MICFENIVYSFKYMTYTKKVNYLLRKYDLVDKHISFIPSPPATGFTKTPRMANASRGVVGEQTPLLQIMPLKEPWKTSIESF